MRQYREIKDRYQDGILFFQVGDFYETFYDDAIEVSRLLNIALTTRDKDKKDPVPLAGVPIHAADAYIAKLLMAGRKVVVCDQVEDPSEARGIVKRKVVDVVTPGTSLSPAALADRENNFIASLIQRSHRCGFALLDLSTGDFSTGEENIRKVEGIINGYTIREALIPEGATELATMVRGSNPNCTIEVLAPHRFGESKGREILQLHFAVENLSCFGIEEKPLTIASAGALLSHVKELRQDELKHITELRLWVSDNTLFIDRETLRNLEIFEPLQGNSPETTLINCIDRTQTSLGARELRQWLRHPARNISLIESRLDGISVLCSDQITLRGLRTKLRRFPDVERLVSRIATRRAGPRELLSLAEALRRVPEITETAGRLDATIIEDAVSNCVDRAQIGKLIEDSIELDCPSHLRDGHVIKKGVNEELDVLIGESEGGRKWIASLQNTERKRTGIPSLKVGYNKVFGYYIEVSRIHDDKVPDDYICKQTLVSSQRYVNKELKEKEQAILTSESRRAELEREIFDSICERISYESGSLQRIARSIATLDVLASLADLSIEKGYSRPELNDSLDLIITEGRHPVVEEMSGKNFIPNDVVIRPAEKQLLIITGPNMGGKSTFIRQAALISILAHAGSFVPASRAVVGVMDRIFTRVGSSDNLAKGQSTFLVEMAETAKILHNCTSRSLVLLDEVGRGTSTLDGLSLAWAVTEYLLQEDGKRPKTLFATHYHELTHLSETFPRVQNLRVEVKEWGDAIIFLYKIRPGASDKSYGIHVARLAGLPESVIGRAAEILETLEEMGTTPKTESERKVEQTTLFRELDPLREHLQNIEINKITPLEALRIIAELQRMARE